MCNFYKCTNATHPGNCLILYQAADMRSLGSFIKCICLYVSLKWSNITLRYIMDYLINNNLNAIYEVTLLYLKFSYHSYTVPCLIDPVFIPRTTSN
jgi:hypothetical protein